MFDRLRNWFTGIHDRKFAAEHGHALYDGHFQHGQPPPAAQVSRYPDSSASGIPGKGTDAYFIACTVISYVVVVGMAFFVHPLVGLLFLWLGLYIAPVAAVLLMVLLPVALFVVVGIAGLVALIWYFGQT